MPSTLRRALLPSLLLCTLHCGEVQGTANGSVGAPAEDDDLAGATSKPGVTEEACGDASTCDPRVEAGTPRSAEAGVASTVGALVLMYIPGDYDLAKSTWTWSADSSGAWVEVEPTRHPSQRDGVAMASDGKEVILFGGIDAANNTLQDTWSWSSDDWAPLTPATSPPARSYTALATLGAQVVLFGGEVPGQDANDVLGDTWVWDGSTWTEAHPAISPPPRAGASLAPLGEGTLVLFGGEDADANLFTDTWIWDGTSWSSPTTPTSPPGAFVQSMAPYDGGVVAFSPDWSADVTEPWSFDGTSWTKLPRSAGMNTPLTSAGVASFAGSVLLYGGYADVSSSLQSHTFSWSGSGWTDLGRSPGPATYASGNTPCVMTTFP